MPVVLTFDLHAVPTMDRNRIRSLFERLGWQRIGGTAFRYPSLGAAEPVEDWFNHVVPALTAFRAYVMDSGQPIRYTLDAHSSTGYFPGTYGHPPLPANGAANQTITLYDPSIEACGEQNLKDWIDALHFPYVPTVGQQQAPAQQDAEEDDDAADGG